MHNELNGRNDRASKTGRTGEPDYFFCPGFLSPQAKHASRCRKPATTCLTQAHLSLEPGAWSLADAGWSSDNGNDTLIGGAGNDRLIGGGNDMLDGDPGTDTSVWFGGKAHG